ncbi:hypothetical protein HOO65_010006 [Ceratocystis lukuohia]|uniref:Uncharacterized protein n=1 Tax=Ceratocystis lukuohia TaxID=2019550 RepID=A0ABR4MQT5_9PEZI
MWLPNFIQPLFMAVLLSTQVIAGDKKVPRPRELGLYIPKDGPWKEVITTDGFFAKVYVSEDPNFIEVASMKNPTADFKSYEALLSIWEYESRLTVRSLKWIMYADVVGTDRVIINGALEKLGHDLSGPAQILGTEISRDSPEHAEIWNSLSTASFAKEAVEICTEFKDMSNRYIQSFKIGRYCDFDIWVHIKFGTNVE